MSVHIIIDENFGRPATRVLAAVAEFYERTHGFAVKIEHVQDFMGASGTKDNEWLPAAAAQGCTIITGDRGKRSGGPKLPRLCANLRITHIVMGGAMHAAKQFDKLRAIVCLWPEIVHAAQSDPGSRYSLQKGADHAFIKASPVPPNPPT